MIRLRFVTCRDPVSATIRAFEYGFWASHLEALMPDGTLLGAHFEGGVQARAHDYDARKFDREMYGSLPASAEMADKFHSFLSAQVGKPYDVEAIIGLVARRDWQAPDSWFCSELIAAAPAACGWFASDLATEFNHATPPDLLLIASGRIALVA
jgi:hypothetical protein